MFSDLAVIPEARRQWVKAFKILRESTFPLGILYPGKTSVMLWSEHGLEEEFPGRKYFRKESLLRRKSRVSEGRCKYSGPTS